MGYSIVGADGREYGPVDKDVLEQWAREGRIVTSTQIIDHDNSRQYLACDMPELAAIFSPPPVVNINLPTGPRPGYPAYPPYPPGAVPTVYAGPPKSRLAAGLLGILLGAFGAHRFYLGYTGMGVAMLLITLLTCGFGAAITSVWGLIEGIICLTGGMTDAQGRPLGD